MPRDLPSGTVTFLFTDIEGSTRLLDQLGPEAYAQALAEHRRILREAFVDHGGVEIDTQGDAFFVAFPTAPGAVAAAQEARDALAEGPIRVRMGLHTGTPHLGDEGYVGPDVHKGARIAAAGHGGQVLVSAATAALLGPDQLRDLGEHRLKDLSAPERIYQLGNQEFPRLKSLHQTNLPIPSTPFLGRERELSEVTGLLARPEVRVLTLTGPGGTGKTRLALQAAGGLAHRYPDGVWWAGLAALRDPQLVLATAAQAIGARDGLADHITDRSMLLVFDNFEQVIAAAADVAGLLALCPNLELLVTSRAPLHVSGEQEYPVPPLAEPEGVELFLARATAAKPDFEPDGAVAEICRRLDNLPLALELAAARVKVLSPPQILERLDQRLPLLTGGARDLPERQRTLCAAIAWSYELLTTEERRLFARLAVFRGGCILEAAEQVAQADVDTLQSLIDKSLVRHREDRFWMLETIREYAAERLEESGEADELRRRHTEHYLAFAEEAEPNLRGSPKKWADRVQAEHDNLRAAMDRVEASGDGQSALRLAGALAPFWYLRSHLVEGRRRVERALATDARPTEARAKALHGGASLAFGAADLETARAWAAEALRLHRALGNPWGTAYSAMVLGNAMGEGKTELAEAQRLQEESVRAFREIGDQELELRATYNLAVISQELGENERARELLEAILNRAGALGLERDRSMSLGALSGFARREGRFGDAISMLAESIGIERDIGDVAWTANNLARLAEALAMAGQAAKAARVLSAAERLHEETGVTWAPWAAEMNEETLGRTRGELAEAAFAEAWEEGRALTIDEALALALATAG